ncbi:LysR family transcriptional regulator [Kitasatospora mediocidica]|uniref:LysR family transcriptional regulator n=1 Tax=Kitasatospora mediocidica TaxID=58352 RepID=UPI00068E8D64|nr:LysR family transcriptional regulator [Kitasatospora mediocidica]
MTPEARLLRSFLTVAEESNFTRAAARLHIAQPALSAQIRQLETQLGVKLLHRTTRVVQLTAAGRAVQERGPAALAALEDVWDAARHTGRGELGHLRLGYSASAGYGTVPTLVDAARRRHPDVQIAAQVLRTPDIAQAVLDGRVDLGIARSPQPVDGIRLLTVRRELRGVLLSADHPLVRHSPASTELVAVAAFPVLVHAREANPAHYDQLVDLFHRAGLQPRLVERPIAFDPTQHHLRDAHSTALVGQTSADGLPDWLRWLPITAPQTHTEIQLVLPAGELPPITRHFEELALATAQRAGWLD